MVHCSSSTYLSSYVYHKPLSENQKSRNLPRTTPGSQNLALDRQNGPDPSDRRVGMPMGAHNTATEDKWDSSWASQSEYLTFFDFFRRLLGPPSQ